jgi:predicted DNA-binding transcriptional regulator YafY
MYHPTTRLLTVLELLQTRGSVTGAELAERLEVDVRSVRRYITMLRDMGIPIDAERGRAGAYHLRPGYRLPPLMFNEDEILAVVMGLLISRQLALTDVAGIESAAAKIERVLPAELRQRVLALQDTLAFNVQPGRAALSGELIATLSLATHQQRRVELHYHSTKDELTTRDIDPYGLVYHAGFWYTAGFCHLRHDLRVFRLDRIQRLRLKGETFKRPPAFDPTAHILESIATMPGSWMVEVLLEMTLDEAQQVIPRDMAMLTAQDDGVLMRVTTNNLPWLARYLAQLSCPLRIIKPDEMRDALRELGERLIQTATQPITHG